MKFTVKEVVRGFSNMAYQIDGQTAQVKCVYIDVAMNAEHGGKGTRTDAKIVESPEIIKQIEHNEFPLICELDFEERATRGKVALVIVGMRPIIRDPMAQNGMKKAA